MLPRCDQHPQRPRVASRASIGGRTHEIRRLIGRSLRAVVDIKALGENTIVLDCDVLQADGGTRTAAITGAYVALADADRVGPRARARRGGRAAAAPAPSPRSSVGHRRRRAACSTSHYDEDSAPRPT